MNERTPEDCGKGYLCIFLRCIFVWFPEQWDVRSSLSPRFRGGDVLPWFWHKQSLVTGTHFRTSTASGTEKSCHVNREIERHRPCDSVRSTVSDVSPSYRYFHLNDFYSDRASDERRGDNGWELFSVKWSLLHKCDVAQIKDEMLKEGLAVVIFSPQF